MRVLKSNCRRMIIAVAIIGMFVSITWANTPVDTVDIKGCENQSTCETIQSHIKDVLNSLTDLKKVAHLFSNKGLSSITELYTKTGFKCINVLYECKLINLPEGGFEIRGVRVRVDMGDTKGNPDQYLVFTLSQEFLITGVRFAMENGHYQHIIEGGKRLKDFANRQKILQFIEIFRTAYNRKDLEYLKKAYSDDALIIVGKVLEKAPQQTEMFKGSRLSSDRIKFVKLSKKQYLTNLEKVFNVNSFIKVDFDELEVIRHDSINDIYGVTLKQHWQSSGYSDEGYLFLMIDFTNEDQPLIHVRTWQSEKFPDGSVIGLYDFNPIE